MRRDAIANLPPILLPSLPPSLPPHEHNRQWDCLAHFFIDAGTKDTLKARFGLQSVPFVMVFDQVRGGGRRGRSSGRETAEHVEQDP
jgi:hypothetical protein